MDNLNEMPWLTKNVTYEGFPLLLRRPHHKRLWKYQKQYTQLFCITHALEKVTGNGLPELEYNGTLDEFDCFVVDLFDSKSEGITLLVETYCGKRHYWFYLKKDMDYLHKFEELCKNNPDKNLEFSIEEDIDWSFVKNYPLGFRGITLKTLMLILAILAFLILVFVFNATFN